VACLAQAIGVSETAIYQWKRHAGWRWASGPYPLDEIKDWRAKTFAVDRQLELRSESITQLEIDMQLKQARMDKVKLETEIMRGRYTETERVFEMMNELVAIMLKPLEEMVQSLPPILVGLEPPAIEQMLDKEVEVIRSRLARRVGDYSVHVSKK